MGDVPANTYICINGHIFSFDQWDVGHAEATRQPVPDYSKTCRRMMWRFHGRSMYAEHVRCASHMFPARKYPVLYSAFLLGGEDAIRVAMIDLLDQEDRSHGQEVKDQG